MTVKELIERLQMLAPTYEVWADGDGWPYPASEVEADHEKQRVHIY
jgi:hypothetical protein